MINNILSDSSRYPRLFNWNGKLLSKDIDSWESEFQIKVPKDLKTLWSVEGGGDLFESETILQPVAANDDDLIMPVSRMFWKNGLKSDYYIFHTGLCLSAFHSANGLLITLRLADKSPIAEFSDLDKWYVETLRKEYGGRYKLSSIPKPS